MPPVATRMGPSINWTINGDGEVCVDGRMGPAEIITSMLRRAEARPTGVPQRADSARGLHWPAEEAGEPCSPVNGQLAHAVDC